MTLTWEYQLKLMAQIKTINEKCNTRLSIDPEHWAKLGVYNIGDFQLYLEREHESNMTKSDQRDTYCTGNEGSIGEQPNYPYALGDLHI